MTNQIEDNSDFRTFFYDRVELSHRVGLDAQIPVDHFAIPFTERAATQPIPFEPDRIRRFTALFDQYVPRNHTEIHDWDTPANWDDLKAGMEALVTGVIDGGNPAIAALRNNATILKNNLMIIAAHLESDPAISDGQKASCLIELAKGGHRGCPTRMVQGSTHYAEVFSGVVVLNDLRSQIARELHKKRKDILLAMSEGDVHIQGELNLSIGGLLHIQNAGAAYNDNPRLMDGYAPQRALPAFLRQYTSAVVLDTIERAINGSPTPGRPAHERQDRKIPAELITQWLRENIPRDFEPNLPQDERQMRFIQSQMHAETNTLTRDGVRRVLVHFGFLSS